MNTDQILERVRKYVRGRPPKKFVAGETYIHPTAPLIDEDDIASLVETALGFADKIELEGPKTNQIDRDLRAFFGTDIRKIRLTNSGSSANLLAVTTITDPVFGSRQAKPKDEIITVAAGFPTTINPIVQNGLVPVFLDVDLDTLVPDPVLIEQAITEKTKGIVLAHPLGNAFDAEALRDIADEYDIWLIEDGCDSLGGTLHGKPLGSFGDISTISFYPAHHLTGGEAGAVCSRSPMVDKIMDSFRSWGRDCWCMPGKDNTCGKRFEQQFGELPEGYDHKFTYSRIGYNLKSTEMSAALLASQFQKLPQFVKARRDNFEFLLDALGKYKKYFRFMSHIKGADPSWFGFLMTVKEAAPFTRRELITYLDAHKVGTRLLFSGNITRQPAYANVHYKKFHDLTNSDVIMDKAFWIGVHPSLTQSHLEYMVKTIEDFIKERT